MIIEIRSLPLSDPNQFFADNRNVWAAESCLRRGLEAALDLGRHILAKGFAIGVTEYKETAVRLEELNVLSPSTAQKLTLMEGYRNRLVHFYHDIQPQELYDICRDRLEDLEEIAQAYRLWLQHHPERLDETL
ncbi:MAG: DUF86 domain-containing protein [Ardenticatenaceae bacterium]|nr:DUF86 domain-containing protein [Ardenticatenaceae bacterium]